jgi:hypothetical protein
MPHSIRIRLYQSQRGDDLLRDKYVTGGGEMNAVIGPQAPRHTVTILAEGKSNLRLRKFQSYYIK